MNTKGAAGIALGAIVGLTGVVAYSGFTPATAADTTNPSFRCSSVTLSAATATAMPTTCTPGRSAVTVQNNDAASLYLGGSDVTATGATKGLTIIAGATANVDVSCDTNRNARVFTYSVAGTSANAVTVCETK